MPQRTLRYNLAVLKSRYLIGEVNSFNDMRKKKFYIIREAKK
jgi:hypothetical protein